MYRETPAEVAMNFGTPVPLDQGAAQSYKLARCSLPCLD